MGRHISSDIISIHALREEGDTAAVVGTAATCGFLSTPSVRRATIDCDALPADVFRFLSTPSVRRATPAYFLVVLYGSISIHALREEGDGFCRLSNVRLVVNFYPRPP